MISASIPSPSASSIEIVGFELQAYGLLIGFSIFAAGSLFSRRFTQKGYPSELVTTLAGWGIFAGLVGARAYHLITDWPSYQGNWGESWQIWKGGLGIPGAIMAGAAAMWLVARRKQFPMSDVADSIAPALPLAQAIGRWGNWFNQELYGRPTDLPWGLEIDIENRRPQYRNDETFHPTFLYECVWNLALMGFLFWVSKRFSLKPGRLFGLYVLGYALGRLWIETIRVDFASQLGGVRVNIWLMLALIIGSVVYLQVGRDHVKGSDDSVSDDEGLDGVDSDKEISDNDSVEDEEVAEDNYGVEDEELENELDKIEQNDR